MPQHTIGAHAGSATGYVSNGPEVRSDAGSPSVPERGTVSAAIGGQFADHCPLGQPPPVPGQARDGRAAQRR